MSETIVCGVDRSPGARAAARVAAALARRLGMRLELLHVCEAGRRPEHGAIHAVQVALDSGLEVSDADVRLDAGAVAERLKAATSEAALVVVGSPAHTGLREWIFGGRADAVARAPAGPVMIVPAGASRRAGVDPLAGRTVACGVRDEHDADAARAAAKVAGVLGLSVTLLHVLAAPVVSPLSGAAVGPAALFGPEGLRAAAEEMLHAIGDDLPGAPGVRVLGGPPGQALARAAKEEQAVLLAVGASGHSSIAEVLTGSVGRELRQRAGLPVLVCPSEGVSDGASRDQPPPMSGPRPS